MSKLMEPKFKIGETVSQYEVVDVFRGGGHWRYQVKCRKCGRERKIVQSALRDASRKQHKHCRACLNKEYKHVGVPRGKGRELEFWGKTDEMIRSHNALMRIWPAASSGHWVWCDRALSAA